MKLRSLLYVLAVSLVLLGCSASPNGTVDDFHKAFAERNQQKMLSLTAEESIKRFGKEAVLKCYKDMNFGYEITFVSAAEEGSYTIARYKAKAWGSDIIVKIRLKKEKEGFRVVLNSLETTWARAVAEGI